MWDALQQMWEALEQAQWVKAFNLSIWMYSAVSVIHYLTMFWFIGSIAVVDLRVMGLAVRKRNVKELGDLLFPWAWTGFSLAVLSGFMMFTVGAGDWAPDPIFHIKLTLMLLGVVFAIWVQKGIPGWERAPQIPTWAKVIAAISLLLWILTILCASEIPSLEGLG